MAFCDFVVRHDKDKETPEELSKKILYSVFIKRLKANKPVICFIGGESGEGKSMSALRFQELLLEMQGVQLKDHVNDINIYTPNQYPKKIERLLFDKSLKKVNIICLQEAREVIKAKLWHNFLTQSVADVNAMARSIKRMCVMIVSQFIRDISNDMRYTLNFYMIVRRPKRHKARLYINVLWKDDRDLEKPKLRKRKLSGYIVQPNGKYKRFVPQYIEMSLPSKEVIETFEKNDYEAKATIIKSKLGRLMEEIEADIGKGSKKIDTMVDWYMGHPESLNMIGRRIRNKWVMNEQARDMHGMSKEEIEIFQKKLNEKFKEVGIVQVVQDGQGTDEQV